MIRFLAPLLLLLLAACDAVPLSEVPERRAPSTTALPPMKTFAPLGVRRPTRSNRDIARDFLDLSFQMESGRKLPYFSRFEGPVRVGVVGGAPKALPRELDLLIARLRKEAGIDIARARHGETVQIVIQALPRREMQRLVPEAACFVVPNTSGWSDFKASRRSGKTDWTQVVTRTSAAIFVPRDVSPQEVRDCLHEELAQALGPLNDLYRLHDSIFNDDNFQTVLTGFDMLVLRAYYSPAFKPGMTREQVAAQIPAVLDRLNPGGRGRASAPIAQTPRAWIDAIETALGARGTNQSRRAAARRAVAIAQQQAWTDARRAFGLFILGRLSMSTDPDLAIASFLQADTIYRSLPGHEVQAAHIGMQLAAYSLSAGQTETAIKLANRSLPAAAATENAALLSTLLMIKAEALDMLGRADEARVVRLDSLGWARYGFGEDRQVRARLHEIATLVPRNAGS